MLPLHHNEYKQRGGGFEPTEPKKDQCLRLARLTTSLSSRALSAQTPAGIEPTTMSLENSCSTAELWGQTERINSVYTDWESNPGHFLGRETFYH